jgi:two-component system, chemotaxis family, chemotaxis protein CheY
MLAQDIQKKAVNNSSTDRAKVRLKDIHILLADKDPCLSHVMIQNLRAMGFTRITYAKSGNETIRALRENEVHVVVTERNLNDADGLELVRSVRAGKHPQHRSVPIIMLSGLAEEEDVIAARDAGINEYLAKPFSSKMLYSRIEQIVDKPRNFLVSETYTGPDRRRRGTPPEGVADRRICTPTSLPILDEPISTDDLPVLITADRTIRKLLGTTEPLSRIITPSMIEDAQKSIDSMAESYMHWLATDLKILEQSYVAMRQEYAAYYLIKAKNAALSLKERTGVFRLTLASDVAYGLYQFLHHDYHPSHSKHLNIISKHIDALKVILGHKIGATDALGTELTKELRKLIISQK